MWLVLFTSLLVCTAATRLERSPYIYRCSPSIRDSVPPTSNEKTAGKPVCVRQVRFPSNTTDQPEMGLNECRLTCGEFSVLWPKGQDQGLVLRFYSLERKRRIELVEEEGGSPEIRRRRSYVQKKRKEDG